MTMTRPNKITGANAGGPRPLPIRTRWAARVAQFWRWRLDHAMKAILPRASALVLALAVSVASCGCASVSAGHRIGADTISFITPGITTKQEVLENLGSPLLDLEGGRLIAYYWETTGKLKASWFWFGREGGEIGPKQKQWAFCVAFDVSGRVTRRATISTENDETVRDAVLKWHAQTK
jgi:outer membrane protein assembly factor BamE (lipoprotein component of BamABCDE complex)